MLEQRYVPAQDLGYQDCKPFIVVCPSCREHVFLRIRGGANYLAHFRRDKALNDQCELRVANIPRETMSQANAKSRGQHLQHFMSVLRNELIRACLQSQIGSSWNKIPTITRMIARPSYRDAVRLARTYLQTDLNSLWQYVEEFNSTMSPYWCARQFRYARDVMEHILAPNSFANFAFAITLSCCIFLEFERTEGKQFEDSPKWLQVFLNGSENEFRRYPKEATAKLLSHDGVVQILMHYLAHIPYIDLLANAKTSTKESTSDELRRWMIVCEQITRHA